MNFKSLFIKEDEPKEKEKVKKEEPIPTQPATTPVFVSAGPPVSGENYKELIEKVLNDRDLPGPDFLEMYKALSQMESLMIPEEQKFIACFASLQVMGVTKDKLVSTATTYIEALEKERTDFSSAIQAARQERVEKRRSEAEALAAENQELQAKIQANILKINELSTGAMQEENNLNGKLSQFELDLQSAKSKIENIVSKIKTYIK